MKIDIWEQDGFFLERLYVIRKVYSVECMALFS